MQQLELRTGINVQYSDGIIGLVTGVILFNADRMVQMEDSRRRNAACSGLDELYLQIAIALTRSSGARIQTAAHLRLGSRAECDGIEVSLLQQRSLRSAAPRGAAQGGQIGVAAHLHALSKIQLPKPSARQRSSCAPAPCCCLTRSSACLRSSHALPKRPKPKLRRQGACNHAASQQPGDTLPCRTASAPAASSAARKRGTTAGSLSPPPTRGTGASTREPSPSWFRAASSLTSPSVLASAGKRSTRMPRACKVRRSRRAWHDRWLGSVIQHPANTRSMFRPQA